MTDTCSHNHVRHTHIWMINDEDPMWRGVTGPMPGSDLGWYEPCPETDPHRPTGDAK